MPDAHLKRMACQIAAQLPDNDEEAVRVLNYVREIVRNLGGGWSESAPVKTIARLYVIQPTSPEGLEEGAREGQSAHPDKANPG